SVGLGAEGTDEVQRERRGEHGPDDLDGQRERRVALDAVRLEDRRFRHRRDCSRAAGRPRRPTRAKTLRPGQAGRTLRLTGCVLPTPGTAARSFAVGPPTIGADAAKLPVAPAVAREIVVQAPASLR